MGQLCLVDRRSKLLRSKESAFLESAGRTIGAFGHVENHCVGVELRRGVTVHGSRRVMLEFRGNKSAGGFGRGIST